MDVKKRDVEGAYCWFHKHPQNPTSKLPRGMSLLRMTDGLKFGNEAVCISLFPSISWKFLFNLVSAPSIVVALDQRR